MRLRTRRMSVSDLLYLYRARLRAKSVVVQDVFAILGIAVGVALLFASQVSSTSLTHSVQKLSGQLVGDAQYQLDARGPAGVSERLLGETRRLPGVKVALPILEQQANLTGENGRQQSVDLIGTDPRLAHFGGSKLRRFSPRQLAAQQAVALPTPIGDRLDSLTLGTVQLQVGARVTPVLVGATLGEAEIGSLVRSPVVIAPIQYAQSVTGMSGRITRIFVQAQQGGDREVQTGLRRLASATHVNLSSRRTLTPLYLPLRRCRRISPRPCSQRSARLSGLCLPSTQC